MQIILDITNMFNKHDYEKWGGGGSGPNDKSKTDGQPNLPIPYTSQGFEIKFQNGFSDKRQKSISNDTFPLF
jgi:hypothetical protein